MRPGLLLSSILLCLRGMHFAKLHGLGNDFLLLDLRRGGEPLPAARALALCDRHLGVGGDGVLTLLPAAGDAVRMLIQNADGSVPEMCGNGARCAALWIATAGCKEPASSVVTLLTDAGPRPCAVEAPDPTRGLVEVEMGMAEIGSRRALTAGGRTFEAWPVSMGNPHRVIFLDGNERLAQLAAELGPALCREENANIELCRQIAPQRYQVSVWERGSGLTQACGTGACAVAAAAVASGAEPGDREIVIDLPGGTLSIRIDAALRVKMRGPAQLVFIGEL